jgi:hypothetical protein
MELKILLGRGQDFVDIYVIKSRTKPVLPKNTYLSAVGSSLGLLKIT